MDEESYWAAVTDMRGRVADVLDELEPDEWEHASLCADWRVRDVAGHLSHVPTVTTWEMVAAAPRGRFNPHRINTLLARRYAEPPTREIAARVRQHAADRHTAAVLDTRDALFDVVVHSQDIALPLGRTVDVPVAAAREGLDRVWDMGWPFRAKRRLAGLSLRAEDTDWAVGEGPGVSGPAVAMLLLLTGRIDAALPSLSGPGLSALSPSG